MNKNFNKTRGDILHMYGSEASQFFEPSEKNLKNQL